MNRPQLPPYYVAPPIYDENGVKIEYGKNGCPKGRDLTQFTCPCNFPKCVYLKENAEAFERMIRERSMKENQAGNDSNQTGRNQEGQTGNYFTY